MPWSFRVEVTAGRSTAAWLRVFREEEVRSDAVADARLLWTPLVACVVSFNGGGGGGALNTNGRGTTHANHRRCTIRVCCNFQEYTATEVEKFHCPRCSPLYGPSIYKPYLNWHRYDYWDANASSKPVQTGTPVFVRELRGRHFANENEVVIHMRGQQLTELVLHQQGFNNPIIVDSIDGLGMTVPPDNFSVYDVEASIGGDMELDVIDVTRQSDIKMKLSDYVAYYNTANRIRIFNVVSLEFSETGLARYVEAPIVARKLDWVNTMWLRNYHISPPRVQKYCLMSVKDSYTDFHVDFGGTSVWYHILRGEKIFYFVKPTPANLSLYQQWMTSTNQSETFFGDQVDCCYKCTLRQGQTMLIPTGWIHAVLTPIDSLVFGGNFLHSLNIPMQLQIYDIEKKVKTVEKFRFPYFESINWFAGQKLYQQIHDLNVEEKKCPGTLLTGLKSLLSALKQWNMEKDYNMSAREQIPLGLNSTKLIKDISKEIRHAERFINTLNPPKPERESKRKRKRPFNKDFVDYPLSPKSSQEYFAETKNERNHQPRIKLTLPKPAMYPYENMSTCNSFAPNDTLERIDWETPSFCRPEQTTAIHRGGAVLKFKLGTKDYFAHNQPPDVTNAEVVNNLISPSSTKSIYDFHDDSEKEEGMLTIDENQKKPKKKVVAPKSLVKPKTPTSWCMKNKKAKTELGVDGILPKNGIESLLKASVLTNKITSDEPGRTSPSTEDAIAGMLSISQMYIQPGRNSTKGGRKLLGGDSSVDEENINNVHQDDDYIYPSLDNSDDEEIHIFKPRGRSKVDEAWNPKARVGPLLPKMNRPTREGTKKQAVEKVLEAAAAKRATESPEKSPKRQYRRRKIKTKPVLKSSGATPCASTSNISSSVPSTSSTVISHKQRKGMKTVKQRLGKILKIHKMIY
ncbi:hypothetical protein RN001_015776 [Aquatica leii]|uniref:JmjC domain-containing protein n=1 Tax=Aquatica leii TaxID=1421715 RepID=A0AAN7SAU6_9COLE|nr:hypothetical protein RN001_015776 [Aquatica leii]